MEQKVAERRIEIKFDQWPVTFTEWAEAYFREENPTYSGELSLEAKKNHREGVMDKLLFRINLILELPLLRESGNSVSHRWLFPQEYDFFLGEKGNRKLFYDFIDEKWEAICRLENKIKKYGVACKKLEGELGQDLDNEIGRKYKKKQNKLEEAKKEKERREEEYKGLEVTDYLKYSLFDEVSLLESEFYCVLLDDYFSTRDVLAALKAGKWWIVDIEKRKKILRCVEQLVGDEKWAFAEADFYVTAMKLLRPHEFILTAQMSGLLSTVKEVYSLGNSSSLRFFEEKGENDKDTTFMEIVYSDALELENANEIQHGAGAKTKGESILELSKAIGALSEELKGYVEENITSPDINEELEMLIRRDFK